MKALAHRPVAAAFAVAFIASMTGCNSGGGGSPEETFETAKAALVKEDMKGFCECLTPENREMVAGAMAMIAPFAALGGPEDAKKIEAVFEKHGITKEHQTKVEKDESVKSPEDAMKMFVEPVKDHAAFVGDLTAAMKEVGDGKQTNNIPITKDSVLKDVKTDGETAKGTIETEVDGEKKSEPIAFKKIDGKWYMDISEQFKGKGPGGPPPGPGI